MVVKETIRCQKCKCKMIPIYVLKEKDDMKDYRFLIHKRLEGIYYCPKCEITVEITVLD